MPSVRGNMFDLSGSERARSGEIIGRRWLNRTSESRLPIMNLMAKSSAHRSAQVSRRTKETDIALSVDLDGTGKAEAKTGVGFFDHMLDLLSRHSLIDL